MVASVDDDVARLRSTLDEVARVTWTDIADGRQLGIGMGEVGITDRNMLALRRAHPSLIVHKHTAYEEVRTGADWEWWLSAPDGWLCLVFQAKLLDAQGRYAGIMKGQSEGKSQVDVLIRSCLLRSEKLSSAVWPLYCFYNSWQGGWPYGVERFDRADPNAMPDGELQRYGCTVTGAWSVRKVLLDPRYSGRRTLRNSYLPISRPWSMLLPKSNDVLGLDLTQSMMRTLSSLIPGPAQPKRMASLPELDEDPAGRLQLRGRLAIYADPSPIARPPDYVLDLLEGKPRPRRLKPLARRVVILPDLG